LEQHAGGTGVRATRERLLAPALEVFAESGYASATMREL
jgi:AcrR family transcriptional regulator